MSYETYEKLDEAVLSLTGTPEWEALIQVIGTENAAAMRNQLDAPDWGEFKFQQGYREALFFVFNLREHTKQLVESKDATV